MTKLASVTAFFFLLCLSCFVSHCLSRPISLKSASDTAVDTAGKFGEEYWFDHPWLHAHPPLSAYAWPKQPWPYYAHSPMHNGGYKWGPWPEKEWPFAQSPKPDDGWKWWPKQGYENHEEVAADEIEEAAVAAPPFAA